MLFRSVRLEGLYDDVNAILTDEMNPRVDLSNLGEGVHRLVVSLDIPDGVEHLNTTDIYITLTQHIEETSETSETSETPEEAFQNSLESENSSTSFVEESEQEGTSTKEENESENSSNEEDGLESGE